MGLDLEHLTDGHGADVVVLHGRGPGGVVEPLGVDGTVAHGFRPFLGLGDGNITFQDSLDFDLSEIESVYEDEGDDQ